MDTSLSDIIEAHETIDAECMGLSVSQYYLQQTILKIKNFQLE